MILTVTLNPALDVTYTVDEVVPGSTHRVRDVAIRAGGKGLNVARVLRTLGAPVRATGLLGGADGARIASQLEADGIRSNFMGIAGESRRTVVVTNGAAATGFWEPGPPVSPEEWDRFCEHYRAVLAGAAVVVLAGSLPAGLPDDAYANLIATAHEHGVETVVDTDGAALRAALTAGPRLVKPNATELAAATGRPVDGPYTALALARRLRADGPAAVVVSLGSDGLVACTTDGEWRASLPGPLAGNATGAGDACVAALSAGMRDGRCWPDLLVDAVACAAAAVEAPVAGVVDPDRMREVRADVVVAEL